MSAYHRCPTLPSRIQGCFGGAPYQLRRGLDSEQWQYVDDGARIVLDPPEEQAPIEIHRPELTEDNIHRFILQHRLDDEWAATLDVAHKCFPAATLQFYVETDPEDEISSWVVIEAKLTTSDADTILAQYEQFIVEWVSTVGPRARSLIALTYSAN